jgi:hypothetical protein
MGWQLILVLCVGVFVLILGALIAVMRVRTIYFGAVADGVVVGQSSSTSRHGSRVTMLYSPVVEFHDANKKKFKFTSSMSVPQMMAEGTKVQVRYLPAEPQSTAEIGSSMRMFGFPIAALFVGTIFIVVALWGGGYLGGTPK